MESAFYEAVRQRAHALWVQEGCPEGRSDQHWQQAHNDVLESMRADTAVADCPDEARPAEASACAAEEVEAQPAADLETCTTAPVAPAPSVLQPQVKGTSLFKIRARQCRYITSEASSPTLFCGAPTAGGSWCQEHKARVLVRVPVRASSKPDPRPSSPW